MSTRPNNQHQMFHGAGPRPPRQPKPGALQWSVRKANGDVISCELRDNGEVAGVEVQLLKDGEWFYGHRHANRIGAELEADELKAERLEAGGTLLTERT